VWLLFVCCHASGMARLLCVKRGGGEIWGVIAQFSDGTTASKRIMSTRGGLPLAERAGAARSLGASRGAAPI
jgi:hypothetical protein